MTFNHGTTECCKNASASSIYACSSWTSIPAAAAAAAAAAGATADGLTADSPAGAAAAVCVAPTAAPSSGADDCLYGTKRRLSNAACLC